ncbi:alpha/beta fold hydrolase [Paenibacillus agricola]|uniref:Alpha/beta hydrolase n=1 Tax=Paenibacillus agricola TaxID=2716264 RepID=A0ABX0J536_9BACL|nr:alpha/beta hydrolase [Paenibacillus agricola]NHN30526.1 alpha/beta hydrolase [Paenibacillus agricola]
MNEKINAINGIEVCSETFGNAKDPAVLLIMGAMASMIWWDAEFCQRLADYGRYVIRFDNRDVGRTTSYVPGKPLYDIEDMVADTVGVLDANGIKQAHLVGMSLGGMLAQLAALRNPERVVSLTLMMSSIFGPNEGLPQIDPKILDYHALGGNVNWADKSIAADYMAEGWRLLAGSKHPFDKQQALKLATAEAQRANNLLSMFNHALLGGGESYVGRIKDIDVPTLVIHGTEDPVLPYEHGIALENEIPKAALITLEGTGHEIPKAEWEGIIVAIVKHTSRS